MTKTQTIVVSVLAAVVVGYTAGIAWWSNRRANLHMCTAVEITITDFAKRQYVMQNELVKLLKSKNLYPVGKQASQIPIQEIENTIMQHPMVREAQCYMLPSGTARIRLAQRIPIMRVVTGDVSYFVDAERKRMPVRESVTTPVMVVTGNIGERMACNELADLVMWIEDSKYWRDKIQSIRVVNPKMVYLVQRPDGTHIILGETGGFKRKMNKLRTLYDKGFEEIGWQTYRELDLRFTGQVVGRK